MNLKAHVISAVVVSPIFIAKHRSRMPGSDMTRPQFQGKRAAPRGAVRL